SGSVSNPDSVGNPESVGHPERSVSDISGLDSARRRPLWLSKEVHWELLRLSVPTVISTLAVPLLGVVDTAVLGRLPDVEQLAGAAAGGVILSVVLQMFFFLRMGTTALVAQRWGGGDRRGATLVLFQSMTIAVVFSAALILLRRPVSVIGFALVGATPEAPRRALPLPLAPVPMPAYAPALGGAAHAPALVPLAQPCTIATGHDVVPVRMLRLHSSQTSAHKFAPASSVYVPHWKWA